MDRSKRRAWTLAAAGATLLIVLYVTGGVLSGLRSTANLVVEPFSWTINEIARPVGHLFAGAINYSDVVAQNEKLRYELGRAEILSNESASMLHQLQQLTTELNVPFVGSLATVAAQVTTISPTNFAAAVDISKGADDGVLVGMPVVANGGLVGSVISTSPHGSTVRLITDVNSVVGVTYAKGTTSILISGRGVNNGLSASAISLTTSISPGTLVSTDGLRGGLYPPGLPVAKVANVTLTPGAATYDLTMIPTANLRNLAYVDVVLWEPST
jgi:rod shape-determining protein MreC